MAKKDFNFTREIVAIILLAFGFFNFICLVSYNPADPALNSSSNIPDIHNWGGVVGAYYADLIFMVLGLNSYTLSLLLLGLSAAQFFGKKIKFGIREILSSITMVIFLSSILHLAIKTVPIRGHEINSGGIIGGLFGEIAKHYFNLAGAYLMLAAGFVISLTILTRLSIIRMLELLKDALIEFLKAFLRTFTKTIKFCAKNVSKYSGMLFKDFVELLQIAAKKIKASLKKPKIEKIQPMIKSVEIDEKIKPEEKEPDGINEPKILERADAKRKPIKDRQLKLPSFSDGSYTPPPISLLDAEEQVTAKVDEKALKLNAQLLERKLVDFEVEGVVTAIHPGPVITMYEFEPKAGTKVGKIVNLQDDLSLVMGGRSVRVVPHLPGKAALGIEIPNHERETVWLKDVIASPQYIRSPSKLTMALGSSTEGKSTVIDLTKMPHLLIAGTTGSGKSVAINTMLISMFYKASPAEVRLILVDPKMLELSIYDAIPHLLLPVVTNAKEAVKAMRWAVREMERRYRILSDASVRNITGYNEKIKKNLLNVISEEQAKEKLAENPNAICHTTALPYIVICIDEMADIMMTATQEMEETITRLAQMARAAGIHLILATQRPSVDVITGLIKANFPARISFKVSARHDSRTILDGNGAEALLGKGDMLFMSPTGGAISRLHGALVTEKEIERVVAHLKGQGQPVYNEEILKEPDPSEIGIDGDEIDDELYDQAVQIVTSTKQASISMVQRKLRIGYNRAARLIERMEAQGIVSAADGSKPRQVLANNI